MQGAQRLGLALEHHVRHLAAQALHHGSTQSKQALGEHGRRVQVPRVGHVHQGHHAAQDAGARLTRARVA